MHAFLSWSIEKLTGRMVVLHVLIPESHSALT
jgi:hypothetical protein